jgi:membrane peptidoglycan carboxypeptidase
MRDRSLLHNAASLLICGLLAGVVVAAAAFPAVAFTGLTAKAGSDSFQDLPSDLKIPQQALNSYIYANDGKTLITTMYDNNRTYVHLPEIAPVMRKAMVDAEDVRFYQHGGVDMKGVLRSLVNNGSGSSTQGASTLTMQYVRNVLKDNDNLSKAEQDAATQDTAGRKLQEMRYAVALEKKLSKDEILERYLNISYFGNGAYGVYAAAQTYFGKTPMALTLTEASMLAGLVQSPPADMSTADSQKYAKNRRSYVLGSMVKQHDVSEKDAKAANKTPIASILHITTTPDGCQAVAPNHNDWGFFCDYVKQWWEQQPQFGSTVAERDKKLMEGGYKIVTSLNPGVQKVALQQSLGVYGYDSKKIMPIAVVQPGTGQVVALSVNRHYSEASGVGNTVNPLITGGNNFTGYQTGSTYKMFTMLAALQQGNPLNTYTNAPKQFVTDYPVAPGPASCGGKYCVKNDSDTSYFAGPNDMWRGFSHSVNTYFVWLESKKLRNGPQDAVNMAKALGIQFEGDPNQGYTEDHGASDAFLANHADQWGAFTLGVAGTFPLELANAYATVAAQGLYCSPTPVVSITDPTGKTMNSGQFANCHQAQTKDATTGKTVTVSKDVFRAAADAATCTVSGSSSASKYGKCDGNGTASSVVSPIFGSRPVAGKTGTAEGEVTESFAGFTPGAAAAGTAVNPTNYNDAVTSSVYNDVSKAVATALHAYDVTRPLGGFVKPTAQMAFGASGQDTGLPSPTDKASPKNKNNGGTGNGTTLPGTVVTPPNGRGRGH